MKKMVADKWVAALRSGKYKKGKEGLKLDAIGGLRYCCLGVLCEVLGLPSKPGSVKYHLFGTESPDSTYLPPEAMRLSGISSNDPAIPWTKKNLPPDTRRTLSSLNDSNKHNLNFKEMADLIEKNWETL